jgi:DNA-binding phage protein
MTLADRIAKFKEKKADTGEDYVPTKDDLTFYTEDISAIENRIINGLTDDKAIQEYFEVTMEDCNEKMLENAINYIAIAKGIKPTTNNIKQLKRELLATYNANH